MMLLRCNKDLFGAKVFTLTTGSHRDIMDGESEAEVASLRHFDIVKMNPSTAVHRRSVNTQQQQKTQL